MRRLLLAASALALALPSAAEGCDLRKLVGRWAVQVVETELVSPLDQAGYHHETSHIACVLRITTKDAPPGQALATATCNGQSSPTEPERFDIFHQNWQPRCEWTMQSVAHPPSDMDGRPGPQSVNGTGDGFNRLIFNRAGAHFLGNGTLSLGISQPTNVDAWRFEVSLLGMKP